MVPTITKFPFAEALPLHAEALLLHLKALLLPFRDKIGIFYFFLRSVGAQASKARSLFYFHEKLQVFREPTSLNSSSSLMNTGLSIGR